MTFTPGYNPVSYSGFLIASSLAPRQAVRANLVINPVPYAFFSSQNVGEIVSCQLNPVTGALATGVCTDALDDATDTILSGANLGLAVDPSNQYLYIANPGSLQTSSGAPVFGITKCQTSNQSILTNCEVLPVSGATTGFQSVFINTTATYAYLVGAGTNQPVYVCSIVSDGNFGACTQADPTVATGSNVVVNSTNSVAYILNGNVITPCSINTSNGMPTSCSTSSDVIGDFTAYALAISPTNTLYTASFIGSYPEGYFVYCQTANDVITSCTSQYYPDIANRVLANAINSAGTFLYVAAGNGVSTRYCNISSTTGSILGCNVLINNVNSAANKAGVALLNF
jgi:hypothetical protein